MRRNHSEPNQQHLADIKRNQPPERLVHETVRVQADAEHVHAEPGKARDDVAENGHRHQATFAHHAAPASVQD